MYDPIIIGGGPAGLTAAVYALNNRLETLVISEDLGGKTAYGFAAKGYEGHEVIRGGRSESEPGDAPDDMSYRVDLARSLL